MTVVQTLRRFNRTHTQRIGVLEESFLERGRPLAQSRLLFEIGERGGAVGELRERLGLDAGYLSRLLRALEADGLVVVADDVDDRRRRRAVLTPEGEEEWHALDTRSDALAGDLVHPLTATQRERLDAALAQADVLLRAATTTFRTVDPLSEHAVASLRAYFAELDRRFPTGFDPGDAVTADADAYRPPEGAFVLAWSDGEVVGCGAVTRLAIDRRAAPGPLGRTAEVKRMWVAPALRGGGLGRRLLAHLEEFARRDGHREVVLDTNDTLAAAVAMYRAAGYAPTDRYNDNPYAQRWFTKPLA